MTDKWDELASTYPVESRNSLNRALDIVSNETKEFGTAADIGCGPGNFTILLSGMFRNVYASDLSRNMLDRMSDECMARNITNVNAIQSDAL